MLQSAVIPKKEDILKFRPIWRNAIYASQTPYGMKGSSDGRYSLATFLRDSMIVAYDIYNINKIAADDILFNAVKKSLLGITAIQLPDGKFVHEITNFDAEHNGLKTGHFKRYAKDKTKMYNEHTVDDSLALWVVPLFLDKKELEGFKSIAKKSLAWLTANLDNNNGFLKFRYQHLTGGLAQHGWMDSWCSVQHDDSIFNTIDYIKGEIKGKLPPDPLALVEAQINTWKALLTWGKILKDSSLIKRAREIKTKFLEKFVIRDQKGNFVMLAHALDGNEKPILISSINQAFALWVTFNDELIIDINDAIELSRKLVSPTFFDPQYGVRTFESGHAIRGDNYHLGDSGETAVYWTMSTGMVEEGLKNFSQILARQHKNQESKEISELSGQVALTILNIGLSDEIGAKEQFYVKKRKLHFFQHAGDADLFASPKDKEYFINPNFQTWTASKLLSASYNPIILRKVFNQTF